ncbi:MAG: hypothetical protein JWM11_6289 [Planctomycetaceae bacterium]|nr:hypothetical protein [Planctomycetaceae bacterium]
MSHCISALSRTLVVLVACHGLSGTLAAQDFKIYTPVFDLTAAETSPRAGQKPQPPIVARSVLYFHANKAYDYIEADGEVLIYEPNAKRFTILHPGHGMSTTITFEELERMVRDAEGNATKKVLRTKEERLEQSTRVDMIEFQLQPRFDVRYDREHASLVLNSSYMSYKVKCVPVDNSERVQAYLRYCDWMARLNYVLHPQAPLPGPRLTLNESLRKRGLMPGEVTMQASIGEGITLRAEHQIDWQFDSHARDRIHQWQTLVDSNEIRKVPFRQFQEVVQAARK